MRAALQIAFRTQHDILITSRAEIPAATCAPSALGTAPQPKEPQLLCDTTCQNTDKAFDIIQPQQEELFIQPRAQVLSSSIS